jgi:hypothetical protein
MGRMSAIEEVIKNAMIYGTCMLKLEYDDMENLEAARELLDLLIASKHDTRTEMWLNSLSSHLAAIKTDIALLERRVLEAHIRQDCYASICEGLLNRLQR